MKKKIEYVINHDSPLVEKLMQTENKCNEFNRSSNLFEEWSSIFKECLFEGSVSKINEAMFAQGYQEDIKESLHGFDEIDEFVAKAKKLGVKNLYDLERLLSGKYSNIGMDKNWSEMTKMRTYADEAGLTEDIEELEELKEIEIPNYFETWSSIDSMKVNGKTYYLMENDVYGDETFYLVITPDFEHIFETFDDIETCLIDEGIIEPSLKLNLSRKAQPDPLDDNNINESLNKSDILDEVEKWAKDDFEQGLTLDPDDYNEFKHLLIDNYPELEKESDESFINWFDYYFDTVNDLRSGDYFDAEHAQEFIERNPHGYYNSENDYGDYDDLDESLNKSEETLINDLNTLYAIYINQNKYQVESSIIRKNLNNSLNELSDRELVNIINQNKDKNKYEIVARLNKDKDGFVVFAKKYEDLAIDMHNYEFGIIFWDEVDGTNLWDVIQLIHTKDINKAVKEFNNKAIEYRRKNKLTESDTGYIDFVVVILSDGEPRESMYLLRSYPYNDGKDVWVYPKYYLNKYFKEYKDNILSQARSIQHKTIKEEFEEDAEREEIISIGKSDWVKTEEDEKVWNSLSDDDKYLLSASNDMGVWFDEIQGEEGIEDRYYNLKNRFSMTDRKNFDKRLDDLDDEPYVDYDDEDFDFNEELKQASPEKKKEIKAEIDQVEKEIDRADDHNNPQGVIDGQQKLDKLQENAEEEPVVDYVNENISDKPTEPKNVDLNKI